MASASLATLAVSPLVRGDGVRRGWKRKKKKENHENETKIKIVGGTWDESVE